MNKEQVVCKYCNTVISTTKDCKEDFKKGWDEGQKQLSENYIAKKDHKIIVKDALSVNKFLGVLFCVYPVSVLFMIAHCGLVMNIDQGISSYLLGCLCFGAATFFFSRGAKKI